MDHDTVRNLCLPRDVPSLLALMQIVLVRALCSRARTLFSYPARLPCIQELIHTISNVNAARTDIPFDKRSCLSEYAGSMAPPMLLLTAARDNDAQVRWRKEIISTALSSSRHGPNCRCQLILHLLRAENLLVSSTRHGTTTWPHDLVQDCPSAGHRLGVLPAHAQTDRMSEGLRLSMLLRCRKSGILPRRAFQ